MTNCPNPEPCCSDCGARYVPIGQEAFCQACFMGRGLRAVAELQQGTRPTATIGELMKEHNLAVILTMVAAQMSQADRLLLWFQCSQHFGRRLDPTIHPEMYAAIKALREPAAGAAHSAQWN